MEEYQGESESEAENLIRQIENGRVVTEENDENQENETPETSGLAPNHRRNVIDKAKRISTFQLVNKGLREQGQAYEGRQVDKTGKVNVVKKDRKVMRQPCSLSARCRKSKLFECNSIAEDDRAHNFNYFWSLNKKAKQAHICALTDSREPLAPKHIDIKRKFAGQYFLKTRDGKTLRVCKTMLCNTLGVHERSLTNWINEPTKVQNSKQKKQNSSPNLEPTRKIQKLRNIINSLNKVPAHYVRSQTDCVFLERNWPSERKMFNWYQRQVEKNEAVSRTTFNRTLRDMKVKIFKWKKDRCDFCEKERIAGRQPQLTEHFKEQKAAISAKNKLKIEIKNLLEEEACCFDLEAALPLPRLFCSASFFRLKLLLSNFTFLNYKTGKIHCFTFTEREAGHDSSVYITCIMDYLLNYLGISEATRKVTLVSDSCAYQNKNKFLGNALLHVSMQKKIQIEHRYLCVGHTHMEIDSYHSAVERNFRHLEQHVPQDYHRSFLEACDETHEVQVIPLQNDYFKDFTSCPYLKSLRPGVGPGSATVASARSFLYCPDGSIKYKLKTAEEWKGLPGKINRQAEWPEPGPLYDGKLEISTGKTQHLGEFMPFIPPDKRQYYEDEIFSS